MSTDETVRNARMLDFDIDGLVNLISSGQGPGRVDTSYLVQIGIWSELRQIRKALEYIAQP